MTPAELLTQGVPQATGTDIVVMPTPEQQHALIQAVQPAAEHATDTQLPIGAETYHRRGKRAAGRNQECACPLDADDSNHHDRNALR